jgi:hypothetical protein
MEIKITNSILQDLQTAINHKNIHIEGDASKVDIKEITDKFKFTIDYSITMLFAIIHNSVEIVTVVAETTEYSNDLEINADRSALYKIIVDDDGTVRISYATIPFDIFCTISK